MDESKITYFLDMGVIVGFLVFTDSKPEIDGFALESSKFLEKHSDDSIVTCYSIMDVDLPKFMKRWKLMSIEIRKKIRDFDYKISDTNLLPQDIKRAKNILKLENKLGKERLNQILISIETTLEIRLDYLKDNVIKDVVIPEKEIDSELKSHFQAVTRNYSDSKVIASAIQYTTTKNKNTVLVTTDYKDFKNIKEELDSREPFDDYLCPEVYFIKIRK